MKTKLRASQKPTSKPDSIQSAKSPKKASGEAPGVTLDRELEESIENLTQEEIRELRDAYSRWASQLADYLGESQKPLAIRLLTIWKDADAEGKDHLLTELKRAVDMIQEEVSASRPRKPLSAAIVEDWQSASCDGRKQITNGLRLALECIEGLSHVN